MKKFEKESCKVPASFLAEEVHAMYPIGTRLDVKENPANATFNGLVVGYYLNYLVVEDQEARHCH